MSTMSALHADLSQIVVDDYKLASAFSSQGAAFRWGMLSAADCLMALIDAQKAANPSESIAGLLFAHQTLLDAYGCTKFENGLTVNN